MDVQTVLDVQKLLDVQVFAWIFADPGDDGYDLPVRMHMPGLDDEAPAPDVGGCAGRHAV